MLVWFDVRAGFSEGYVTCGPVWTAMTARLHALRAVLAVCDLGTAWCPGWWGGQSALALFCLGELCDRVPATRGSYCLCCYTLGAVAMGVVRRVEQGTSAAADRAVASLACVSGTWARGDQVRSADHNKRLGVTYSTSIHRMPKQRNVEDMASDLL